MTRIESVPTTWDDARDEPFFRLVCHLLDPRFVELGSVLLETNDAEAVPLY